MHYMTVMLFRFTTTTARSFLVNKFHFICFVCLWTFSFRCTMWSRQRFHSWIIIMHNAFIEPIKIINHRIFQFFKHIKTKREHTVRAHTLWPWQSCIDWNTNSLNIHSSWCRIEFRFFSNWKYINNNYRFFGFSFLCAPTDIMHMMRA